MPRKPKTKMSKRFIGGLLQKEEQETPPPISAAKAYAETIVTRSDYGPPMTVSARERRLRNLQDADFNIGGVRSPFPAPSKDLPLETIAYIARYAYERKPLP